MRIGFIDSGIGGMITARYFQAVFPNVEVVYFCDSLFFPYERLQANVIISRLEIALEIMKSYDCCKVIIACNTISVIANDRLGRYKDLYDFEIIKFPDLILDQVSCLSLNKQNIGVVGTKLTIDSNYYQHFFFKKQIKCFAKSAEGFALIAENYYKQIGPCPDILKIINEYLSDFKDNHIGILVLACTHYTVFKSEIANFFSSLGREVVVVDGLDENVFRKKFDNPLCGSIPTDSNATRVISSKLNDVFINLVKKHFGEETIVIKNNVV